MDSIGSFAESLISEDLQRVDAGKQSDFLSNKGLTHDPECPDISEIELNDAQRKALIMGESYEVAPPEPRKEEPAPQFERVLREPMVEAPEDPIGSLVNHLSYLVEKAESLVNRLDELTAAGSCGTFQKFNLLGQQEAKPKPSLPPRVTNKIKQIRRYRR